MMKSYQAILVAIDFSKASRLALREALRFSEASRATVHALHVIDAQVVTELEEALADSGMDIRTNVVDDARRAWREFAAGVPDADGVRFDVRIAQPVEGIVDAARTLGCDLLILGATGESANDLGTVAAACARNAHCDVLLMRDRPEAGFRKILACVDFSATSSRAVARAAEVAALGGAALYVVHVYDAPWHRLHYRAPTFEAAPAFVAQYTDVLSRRLHAFAADAIPKAQPFEAVLLDRSSYRTGIADYAGDIGADLIVVGGRGKSRIRDRILGSTAERIMKLSRCSVLIVASS